MPVEEQYDERDPYDMKGEIRKLERQRVWFFPAFLLICIFFLWVGGYMTAGELFKPLTGETGLFFFTWTLIAFLAFEMHNLRILLMKAEYREWLRGENSNL